MSKKSKNAGDSSKNAGDSSKDESNIVNQTDEATGNNSLTGDEPIDLSQIGTRVAFGEPGYEHLSALEDLQGDLAKFPSQVLQSSLNEIEPLDLSSISEKIVLDDSLATAWDAIKQNRSIQETLSSISLQDDFQLEKDYWKTLIEEEPSPFNLILDSKPSFYEWANTNRDSLDIDWDEILKGSDTLDLDSLATATATAARYIHFFDGLDEDRRYLTLRDDGALQFSEAAFVEVEKDFDGDLIDDEADKEVVDLRPGLLVLSKQTQTLPLGLLMVAVADEDSSLEQYGIQIGVLPESAARALIQCVISERSTQSSEDRNWNRQYFIAAVAILAAILGAFFGAALPFQ